jgi:hypothetical protein
MDDVIPMLTQQGEVIVDPADIRSVVDTDGANNFLNWNPVRGDEAGRDAECVRSPSSMA